MKIDIKKVLGITAGVVLTGLAAYFSTRYNEEDGFSNLTDEELAAEREKIRLDYCNPDLDDSYRDTCFNKLRLYDAEMHKRKWGDKEPTGHVPHREHGWYLPNDD